jgi:hypothetical protein
MRDEYLPRTSRHPLGADPPSVCALAGRYRSNQPRKRRSEGRPQRCPTSAKKDFSDNRVFRDAPWLATLHAADAERGERRWLFLDEPTAMNELPALATRAISDAIAIRAARELEASNEIEAHTQPSGSGAESSC